MLKDLSKGKEGEQLVIDKLTAAGFICKLAPERSIEYDIHCCLEPKEFTIEVKFDLMASKTGNVAVEYWNSKSNKPSGVTATKANLWCHIIGDKEKEIWITKTDELRSLIQTVPPLKIIQSGGNKNSDMMIYTKDAFCKKFKRIDQLTNIEVFRLIQCLTSN